MVTEAHAGDARRRTPSPGRCARSASRPTATSTDADPAVRDRARTSRASGPIRIRLVGRKKTVQITDIVLAPWRAGQLVVHAAEDLNAIAERARRDPDPVEEVRERLDALLAEIGRLVVLIGPLRGVVAELVTAAELVDATAGEIVVGGRDLTTVARGLDERALALLDGGERLRMSSESLDAHSVELIDGGEDLTAVAQELAATLRVFRAVLPRLLEGLDTVEQLEEAVETVADTVEPLAGAAEGVGKITKKLSRRARDPDPAKA
jgi:hypothetical protein